jgi:prepilin-type N-terminal cleavage/methylation domain-containing protein
MSSPHVPRRPGFSMIELLVVLAVLGFLLALLLPAMQKVREAAARAQTENNLKQLAIAMHAYHDVNKTFPAHASYDKRGRPLLSWRVHILPFIEQKALYNEFHLDEPWDSPHNKKVIARMPAVYRSPTSRAAPGKTTYVVVVGKDTMFPPGPKGVRVGEVTDGLSLTIMIVEADDAHAVPWTKPEDLPFDPQHPFRGLGGKAAGYLLAAMGDGSVRLISRKISANDVRGLFTRNGGEVIGDIP